MAETGTVTPMESRTALTMLAEMTINGVLPPVLVLRWRETGNHFQAVTYEGRKHAAYADNLPAMAAVRNGIRSKFGEQQLDAVPYDAIKNAKAAALTLKSIRRANKATKEDAVGVATTRVTQTGTTEFEQQGPLHSDSMGAVPREAAEAMTSKTAQPRQESEGHGATAEEAGIGGPTVEGEKMTTAQGRAGDTV
jgi:hypothetical protein